MGGTCRTQVEKWLNERGAFKKKYYPEMVSGVKESHKRAYKFATLTIIAEDTALMG